VNVGETVTLYRRVGPGELVLFGAAAIDGFHLVCPINPSFIQCSPRPMLLRSRATGMLRLLGRVMLHALQFCGLSWIAIRSRPPGGSDHLEYRIPAVDLPEFNENIVGSIEIVSEFFSADR
jgi:hypothetical protein